MSLMTQGLKSTLVSLVEITSFLLILLILGDMTLSLGRYAISRNSCILGRAKTAHSEKSGTLLHFSYNRVGQVH